MTIREITAINALDAIQAEADEAAQAFARRFDNGEFVWNDDDTLTIVSPDQARAIRAAAASVR